MSTAVYYRCTGTPTVGLSPEDDLDNWEVFTPSPKIVDFGDPGLPNTPYSTTIINSGGAATIYPTLTGTGGLAEATPEALTVYWALHTDGATYAYRFVSGAGTQSLPDRVRASDYSGYFVRIV